MESSATKVSAAPRADSVQRPHHFIERLQPRSRTALYIVVLLAINVFFVKKLFFVDFTNNMQTNVGSFLAISRFVQQHWPRLDWFPFWFNGLPFENAYSPMLPLVNAGVAWLTGWPVARAYNALTGFFFATGPVFLFVMCWRMSRFLETSFLAAVFYSLLSPAVMFRDIRADAGGWWMPWRMRVLVVWGEGPHTMALSLLPIVLLFCFLAVTRRTLGWRIAALCGIAFIVLVNAFAAVDLAIGCACLLAMLPMKQVWRASLVLAAIGLTAYFWISPFLTPTLLATIQRDSQWVGGDFSSARLFAGRFALAATFVVLWFGARAIRDFFTRFSLLFGSTFFAIVALAKLANLPAFPQPNRYSLELEMGFAIAVVFSVRPLWTRLAVPLQAAAVVLIAAAAVHQIVVYRAYARTFIQTLDIASTIEYKAAAWIGRNIGEHRAFVAGDTGLWLNAFVDTPQMNSGHGPFNPNRTEEDAAYAILSGENAGPRDAAVSILWLKAFGCHAVYVPGSASRVAEKPFVNTRKFDGVLPVLWREEDDTIYAVPQRTTSLAHVVPRDVIVKRPPIHGLDTDETSRFVAAFDNQTLPEAPMTWRRPGEGHISATLGRGDVVHVQTTYDKGWIAYANGRPANVERDGLGLTVINAACNGKCDIDFVFDGGLERKTCRAVSWSVSAGLILALAFIMWACRTPKRSRNHVA